MTEFQIDDEYKFVKEKETGFWRYSHNGTMIPITTEKAFKFYSLNINNIDSLLNSYFYLSNPSSFNDPFDCNLNLLDSPSHREKIKEMTSIDRNNFSNLGVVSMTEIIDNHVMWAHYTKNYNGFAIEFNGSEVSVIPSEDQTAGGAFRKVIYPNNLVRINKEYPFAIQYMLTTKLKHWEYENEWRFITFLGQEKDRILHYDPKKIKGIYIGHQIIESNPSAYRLILSIHSRLYPEVPVYEVYPHPTELELHFVKVLPK